MFTDRVAVGVTKEMRIHKRISVHMVQRLVIDMTLCARLCRAFLT